MSHPYKSLAGRSFWKPTISQKNPLDIEDWYRRKFPIADGAIGTAGSCFAQHIGRQLRQRGYDFLDTEPAPPGFSEHEARKFGYSLFSARTGNIYTARQLRQLAERAFGLAEYPEAPWPHRGGFVDPFRPAIEPEPLPAPEDVAAMQANHLSHVRRLLERARTLVFTLGLTEAWASRETGAVFPLCPGVAGGAFDPARHVFHNFDVFEVVDDLERFLAIFRRFNPGGQLLLTVSPVPLVATATDQQVAVATSYSKSVLRAAAGHLAGRYAFVDYFPSFEIIASPPMRAIFYEPDMRSVSMAGVGHVMKQFFAEHPVATPRAEPRAEPQAASRNEVELACEEMLLELDRKDVPA